MGDSGIESKSKHFRNGDFYTGGWKSGLVSDGGLPVGREVVGKNGWLGRSVIKI